MPGIGIKHLFVTFGSGAKQSGIFQPVEFDTDGVARFSEFCFQSTQLAFGLGVQKELK
jgi:hypothetical protein